MLPTMCFVCREAHSPAVVATLSDERSIVLCASCCAVHASVRLFIAAWQAERGAPRWSNTPSNPVLRLQTSAIRP